MRKETIEYIIKEKITSLRNSDWARLKEIDHYCNKCILTIKEKRFIELEVKKELETYRTKIFGEIK